MTRWISVFCVMICCATLTAGEFEQAVADLGDTARRAAAVETLAKAGNDALEDLLDGLKQDPDETDADLSATVKAERRLRRHECARLLGTLRATDAVATLSDYLKTLAVVDSSDPDFAAACASALGRICGKDKQTERATAVPELERIAGDDKLSPIIRWGALHGLEAMGAGGEVAAPLVTNVDMALPVRVGAIRTVVAAGRKQSADDLHGIWQDQHLGSADEEGNRSNPDAAMRTSALGLTALHGLALLEDSRAVSGLVDFATMPEYAALRSLREEAVRLMQLPSLKTQALQRLTEVLKDDATAVQHDRAAQTLGEFGADGVTAFLGVAEAPPPEGKPETHYRDRVDRFLPSLNAEEALSAFATAYRTLPASETSKKLRDKIIEHLLQNRHNLQPEVIALLREAADDAENLEPPRRATCINVYADNRGKDSFEDLKRWAASDEPVIRAQAVDNLGRNYIPLKDSKPLLTEAAKSPGEEFSKARVNALRGLQRSDDKELLSLFVDALSPEKEPSAEVRSAALTALDSYRAAARIRDDEIFPVVKGRLGDPDHSVRAAAVRVTVTTAQRLGETKAAVEAVEQALGDIHEDVRSAGYQQMMTVATGVTPKKVVDAALKEEATRMKSEAATALSRLSAWGHAESTRKVWEFGVDLLKSPAHVYNAAELLKKAQNDPTNFTYITGEVRSLIDEMTASSTAQHSRVAPLLDVLIALKDEGYFKRVLELSEISDVTLRRKCVDFISTFGTIKDVAHLKALRDRTDAAANATRDHINRAIQTLEDRG